MNFKWVGPVVLLAALFVGDQIRINRPGHKYRLTVEVETCPHERPRPLKALFSESCPAHDAMWTPVRAKKTRH